MSSLNAPHFQNPDKAREYLERLRWNGEPVCPHCGTVGGHYATKKPGVWRCAESKCRKDFSVTTKTVMEASHIKLNVWLQAFALMTASKKGMSAHQLHRMLGVTYKSAWFLAHRIREAMRNGGLLPPMGGEGKIVEADETYFGKPDKPRISPRRAKEGRPYKSKKARNSRPVVALVERGGNITSHSSGAVDSCTTVQRFSR